jgi:Immunoglobulin-like domain of bacterial spore germination
MCELFLSVRRAGWWLALGLLAALVVACAQAATPTATALVNQSTVVFGQAGVQAATRQPQAIPSSTAAPSPTSQTPLAITIDTPAPGTLVGSPVVITGRTARLPKNSVLEYSFTNNAGQQLSTGAFPVAGAPGQPSSFNATLNFNLPRDGGAIHLTLFERDAANGLTAGLDMVVDAQYQSIAIDTPPPSTVVGSPLVLTGRTSRSPSSGSLNYRVVNSAGQQIGAGNFPIGGAPGYPRGYNAELFFDLPINGDSVRVELYDWNATSGTTEASQSIDLVVLPIPQQIIFDTPSPGTIVGSPMVITGRTTRFPFNGDLNYRFTDSAGQQLGAGTFQVVGPVDQPTTFNPSLTFILPNDGGPVHLEVYDQNPDNGATVANRGLDLDVLAQYQAIAFDTPPAGTQVGSPVVITGRTNLYPNHGQLRYRLTNATGQQIGAGNFPTEGGPGQRGSFVASLTFTEPANGGTIRLEIIDQADGGAAIASAAIELIVAPPPPQQIVFDTPPAGTQVGSPVVITGHTTRYPANGKLSYRVRDAAGNEIGAGQFDVVPDSAGSPTSRFNVTLTFTEPRGGGNIILDIYVPSAGGALASISLYVAPQP